MHSFRGRRVPLLAAILALSAAAALAQGGAWDLPAGFTPQPQPSPGTRAAMVGPITFSEPEFPLSTTVDGLVVNSIGGAALTAPLSFSFSSADAQVTTTGPGTSAFIASPNIEGDANGTLTIDFGMDVSRVAFGFAQNCPAPLTPSATITAFDSGAAMIGSTNVPAAAFGFFFLENGVDFSPASPARSVQITFDTQNNACSRFALDNLAFDAVMAPSLPMPALMALALLSLGAGAWILRRGIATRL